MMRPATAAAWAALALVGAGCAARSGLNGDPYEARRKLARELMAREEWGGAFATVDQLHRERSEDGDVLALRGIIFRERGMPAEAEADLKAAIGLEPGLAEAHAALGILYDVTERGQLAEEAHRKAVGLEPKNPAYLNNLGFSLYLRGQPKEAIGWYLQAARLSPAARRVRTNLGFAYAAAGDLPRAAHEFSMGGTPAEAKNNLGFAYEQRGDLERAYTLYVEAARLDPQSRRARQNLTHVAKSIGKEVPVDIAKGENDDAQRSE